MGKEREEETNERSGRVRKPKTTIWVGGKAQEPANNLSYARGRKRPAVKGGKPLKG